MIPSRKVGGTSELQCGEEFRAREHDGETPKLPARTWTIPPSPVPTLEATPADGTVRRRGWGFRQRLGTAANDALSGPLVPRRHVRLRHAACWWDRSPARVGVPSATRTR